MRSAAGASWRCRTAIGAGRERLVRQLMTESLLLAGFGGALGIGVAVLAVPLLAQLVPSTLPIAALAVGRRPRPAVRAGLTAFTGIVFGLAPVLRAGGSPDLEGLREGSRSGGGQKERLRSALVVAEIVASVVLLVSAGLLMRALLTIQGTDPGLQSRGRAHVADAAADARSTAGWRRARRSTHASCRRCARCRA